MPNDSAHLMDSPHTSMDQLYMHYKMMKYKINSIIRMDVVLELVKCAWKKIIQNMNVPIIIHAV